MIAAAPPTVRVAVLASGRGSNLQALLDAQSEGRLVPAEIVIVASDVPDAPALDRARAGGIDAVAVDRKACASRDDFERSLATEITSRGVDLVVLAGFMRLLSGAFLRQFPDRVINVHPALLPAFPGLHGARQAIHYGVKIAGCTVHLVDEGTDTGPVLLQASVDVHDDDDEASLAARILPHEHRLLVEAVRLVASGAFTRRGRLMCRR